MAKTATKKTASKATETPATAVLSVENIETYYGPIQAVKGLSIEVKEGALVTLLGANGAGKSSTLKTISGILEPDKGRVLLKGQDITGFRPDRVAAQGIAHVPEGREVFPFLSVRENLLMGAYLRSDKDAVERDIEAVYDYFPILRERADQRAEREMGLPVGSSETFGPGRCSTRHPCGEFDCGACAAGRGTRPQPAPWSFPDWMLRAAS